MATISPAAPPGNPSIHGQAAQQPQQEPPRQDRLEQLLQEKYVPTAIEYAGLLRVLGRLSPKVYAKQAAKAKQMTGADDPPEIASLETLKRKMGEISTSLVRDGDELTVLVEATERSAEKIRKGLEFRAKATKVGIAVVAVIVAVLLFLVLGGPSIIGGMLGISSPPPAAPAPSVKCPSNGTTITDTMKALFDSPVGGTSKPAGKGWSYTGKSVDARCEVKNGNVIKYTSPP